DNAFQPERLIEERQQLGERTRDVETNLERLVKLAVFDRATAGTKSGKLNAGVETDDGELAQQTSQIIITRHRLQRRLQLQVLLAQRGLDGFDVSTEVPHTLQLVVLALRWGLLSLQPALEFAPARGGEIEKRVPAVTKAAEH